MWPEGRCPGFGPRVLELGEGRPGCSVPGPQGCRFEVLACSFGNRKERGKRGRRRPRSRRQRWHERDLECFCVRVPLPPLSVLAGPGAPRAGDLLWRNSSPGCAAVSAAPTPPGWREVPGIPPHRTCVGDREREEWPVPWLHRECPANLLLLSVDRASPGFEGKEPRNQMFPNGQLPLPITGYWPGPLEPHLYAQGSLLAQVLGMGHLASQASPPCD